MLGLRLRLDPTYTPPIGLEGAAVTGVAMTDTAAAHCTDAPAAQASDVCDSAQCGYRLIAPYDPRAWPGQLAA